MLISSPQCTHSSSKSWYTVCCL